MSSWQCLTCKDPACSNSIVVLCAGANLPLLLHSWTKIMPRGFHSFRVQGNGLGYCVQKKKKKHRITSGYWNGLRVLSHYFTERKWDQEDSKKNWARGAPQHPLFPVGLVITGQLGLSCLPFTLMWACGLH